MSRDHAARGARDGRSGFWIEFRNRAGGTPGVVATDAHAWGTRLRQRVREQFGRRAGVRVFLESLPQKENRITLDRRVTDTHGSPVAHVRYHIGSYERAGIVAASTAVRSIYAALRATEVRESSTLLAAHLLGGHRMGIDPRASVVDDTQRAHGHPNLWLAGGGSFVTASWANPTLTLVALAIRTADALVRA